MSQTSEVRAFVAGAYESPSWKYRVANMPTRQLYAIYGSMKRAEEKKAREARNSKLYYQFTIFDYNEKGELIK